MATRDPAEIQASIAALTAEADAITDLTNNQERLLEISRQAAQAQLEYQKALGKTGAELDRYVATVQATEREQAAFTEAVNKLTPSFNSFDSALQRNIKTITGVEDASDTLIGSFAQLYADTGNLDDVFNQAKATFEKTFNALNVGVSISRKFIESTALVAKEIDAGIASFNKATGAGDLYNKQIQAAEKSNRQFGLSIDDIAEARIGLADGLSGFAILQEQEQDRLIELSAQFTRVGVSTADFVGILETGTRVLGLNTAQVTEAAEEIRSFGQSIGVTTGKIMSEFNAALPALASFGAEATEIFKGLQLISQETGLATGELTSFADQFLSIETTARAVAGVQAVVGNIGIDQLTLLQKANEGQDAVIEYFRGALLQRGGYESLNRLQKVALANQLNIDEATLAGLMNTNNAIEEKTELETDFNKALEAGIGLSEQFNILIKQLAIGIQPVVEGVTSVIGGLANVFGMMPGLLKGTIATASAVGGAVLFAKKMSRGSSPANPVFVSAIGAPGGGGGGGFMGSRTGRVLGGGLGALGLASTIADEGRGYSAGGVLGGAASGAMLGQALIPIPGVGAGIGAVVGGALSYFNNGGGVGGSGPTPIVAHGGEVVVPVTQTPAAENLANMVAQKVSQTAVAQGAPTVQVFIGNEQISDFITKVQNTNLGRPPNLRPVVGV
jgi:hypothetical protein